MHTSWGRWTTRSRSFSGSDTERWACRILGRLNEKLSEMGDWDLVFDETYLQAYLPQASDERSRDEALAAAALAEVEPGAELLDCPCGFGRHSIPLAQAGYHVTGLDRSPTQLAEAERRRGNTENPRLLRGDYRALPFDDSSFDAVLTLFSSLGYFERDEDIGVLRELRRVLRPDECSSWRPHTGTQWRSRPSLTRGSAFPTEAFISKSATGTGRRGRSTRTASSCRRPANASSGPMSSASTPRRNGSNAARGGVH